MCEAQFFPAYFGVVYLLKSLNFVELNFLDISIEVHRKDFIYMLLKGLSKSSLWRFMFRRLVGS